MYVCMYDRKPLELFYEMKRVAGSNLDEAAVKSLWTKRQPEFAQPVVAASSGTPAEFTRIADTIVDAMVSNQIGSVRANSTNDINELRAAVIEMENKFERFSTRADSRSRRAPTPRSRSKKPSNSSVLKQHNWRGMFVPQEIRTKSSKVPQPLQTLPA